MCIYYVYIETTRHGVNSILSIPIPIPIPPNSIWSIPIPIPHQIYQFQFKIDQFQFNSVYIFFIIYARYFWFILLFYYLAIYRYVQCNLPNQDSQVSALNCPDQTSVLIRQVSWLDKVHKQHSRLKRLGLAVPIEQVSSLHKCPLWQVVHVHNVMVCVHLWLFHWTILNLQSLTTLRQTLVETIVKYQ